MDGLRTSAGHEYGDPTVAQYLRQNAVWWIEETGADALRIDTFPYVNRGFWNGFNGELKQLYPRLTEVGEVFNADPIITCLPLPMG